MCHLTDMINIGKTLEVKLNRVGISTPNDLRRIGSREAFKRMLVIDTTSCLNMLLALEGAVQGIRWHNFSNDFKEEQRCFYNCVKKVDKSKMKYMLVQDKNFKPVEAILGDEIYPRGIFDWNITKMIEYIKLNLDNVQLVTEDVSLLYKTNCLKDEISPPCFPIDFSIPVIQAEINHNNFTLIDGNHRVHKAYHDGKKSIQSYKLTVDQHMQFFSSDRAYKSFVDYWNGKLR